MALKDKLARPADPAKIQKLIKKYGGSETDVWAISSTNGFVRFDGTTVVLQRTLFGRINVGKGEKRVPARHITAIQLKPASPLEGFIQFSIGGGNEVRSRFGRQSHDAATDENSMPFTIAEQRQFEALRDAIETSLALPEAGPVMQAVPGPDALDQLRKLGELRDAGVVSEEEFNEKKAILMQRL